MNVLKLTNELQENISSDTSQNLAYVKDLVKPLSEESFLHTSNTFELDGVTVGNVLNIGSFSYLLDFMILIGYICSVVK